MIWVLAIGLCFAVSLYLSAPFLAREVKMSETGEIEAYKEELRAIDRSEEPETAKKAILQARLLRAAKSDLPIAKAHSAIFSGLIFVAIIGASLGLYAILGAPNFTPETRQLPPAETQASSPDFQSLLPRFEARLAENPNDATGWYLYGRTLMLSGDNQAGLRAYETALGLTDTPEIRKEYEAAKTFAAQIQTGPSADDIAAMQNLTEADRQAAIENMVESLRARLVSDPTDAQGWARLLRSRKVLGQTEAARIDIETLREVLPEQADAIVAQSGWSK